MHLQPDSTITAVTELAEPTFARVVKMRLAGLGRSVKWLSGKIDVSRQNTSLAIHHPDRLPTVAERIRKELGLSA